MIQQIDNALFINEILELAANIPDMQVKALEKMLIEGVTSKNAKILVQKIYGKIRSFIYASIVVFDGADVVFIQTCYCDPDDKYIGWEFMTKMREWAKERGIKRLVMMTKRNPKAWERRFHFKHEYNLMTRSVI